MLLQKILRPSISRFAKTSGHIYFKTAFYNSEATAKKSLYKVLNISYDASPEDVKKSYLDLARKYHPDTAPEDTTLPEKFKEISEAYRTLSDPKKRQQYDVENGIITESQANYQKVDPDFKNEDLYADWVAKSSHAKIVTDRLDQVDKHFAHKYFGDQKEVLKSFGEQEKTAPSSLMNKGIFANVLYDFRHILLAGFLVFSVSSVGAVVYEKNKEKKRIDKQEVMKDGKGLIIKLLPLNPT